MKAGKSLAAIIFLLSLTLLSTVFAGDSGTFRGKWWNYYDRALAAAERGDYESAKADLLSAIKKRGRDQHMARTYGMHFTDYFPHRELGVIYYSRGDMENAAKELEESMKSQESAKAAFYLNKVKQHDLEARPSRPAAPELIVLSPASDAVVKDSSVVVRGKAAGAGHIAKVMINGNPFRFDRAVENMEFTQEVPVEDGHNEIVITAGDLVGGLSTTTVNVTVDRDGPSVQVFEVKPEEEAGRKYLRLVGEVSDATSISRLSINGRAVDVSGQKTFSLNMRLETGAGARVRIEAADSLDNETGAEIDAGKELLALRRPFKPFMVASLTDKLIAFDRTPPEVTLKTADDVPPVFSERFYVEGEASDDGSVGRIVINNKKVFARPGKRVFFSKAVSLREGKNTVTVDVFDASDNKTSRTISVTRKISSVKQNASRMSITILPIDGAKSVDRAQLAYEKLIGAFVDQKRFSVVERTKLEHVLREQKLTAEKLTDPEHSIRVGRLMSADAVLSAVVHEDSKSLEIVARVISTETSEVLSVKDSFVEDKGLAAVRELTADLAAKVAAEFPVIEGMVVKAGKRDVYTDVGEASNVKMNMTVIFFRRGEEIRHPVTGKSLGFDTVKLGEGRIEDVAADYSKVRLMDKPRPKDVRVKDLIITK